MEVLEAARLFLNRGRKEEGTEAAVGERCFRPYISMAIRTFQRREIKFLLDARQYRELQPVLLQHMSPDPHCIDGKEYGVYNIYFDTPDNFLIRESLAKPYYKEKIRLRSYASPAGPDDLVFLEIKKKIGGIVTKRRVTMTLREAERYLQTRVKPQSEKYLQQQVLRELDVFLNNYTVSPKQYISYQRSAFFGKQDSDFRLTFDRQITERREALTLSKESFGSQIILPEQRLMEVKVTDSIPAWLSQELSRLGIYKTSFSKYGRAYQRYVQNQMKDRRINVYA